MTEDSVAAIEAAPETVVIETPEGTEGQVETPPAEGQPEEKSESAKRREREKAYRARLQTEAAEAKAEADAYNLEAERLKRLATTATNNENRLRELVRAAMEATGQTKIETPRFKARIQKNGQPKVTVPDVAAAPSDVVVRREMFMVDNSKVIELFKAGFDVSGWATVEYGSHLRIA